MAYLLEKIFEFFITLIAQGGYLAVGILSLLGSACIPIPNELVLLFSGFLVSSGKFNMVTAIGWGTGGNFVGCLIAYYLGKYGGRPWLEKYGKYLLISPEKLEAADSFFNKYGEIAIFLSRFTPIIRGFASLPAGISRMSFPKFTFYSLLGSLLWSIGFIYFGSWLGPHWKKAFQWLRKVDYLIVVGILLLIVVYFIQTRRRQK